MAVKEILLELLQNGIAGFTFKTAAA